MTHSALPREAIGSGGWRRVIGQALPKRYDKVDHVDGRRDDEPCRVDKAKKNARYLKREVEIG